MHFCCADNVLFWYALPPRYHLKEHSCWYTASTIYAGIFQLQETTTFSFSFFCPSHQCIHPQRPWDVSKFGQQYTRTHLTYHTIFYEFCRGWILELILVSGYHQGLCFLLCDVAGTCLWWLSTNCIWNSQEEGWTVVELRPCLSRLDLCQCSNCVRQRVRIETGKILSKYEECTISKFPWFINHAQSNV